MKVDSDSSLSPYFAFTMFIIDCTILVHTYLNYMVVCLVVAILIPFLKVFGDDPIIVPI